MKAVRHLLLALLLIPVAQAVVWDDPAGDHEMGHQGTWVPAPAGWHPQADVVRMELSEVDERWVRLEVELASTSPGSEPIPGAPVEYGFKAVGDPLNATWLITQEGSQYMFFFVRDSTIDTPDGQRTMPQRVIGSEAKRDGNVLSGTILKGSFTSTGMGLELMLDAGPRAGDSISLQPFVGKHLRQYASNELELRDTIGPAKDFIFQIEPERRGDIELYVEHQFRGSNGAATTYVYDVSARNEGTTDHMVRLTTSGPAEWIIRAPFEVMVPAGQTIEFPVAVTVPFSHQHGTFETVTVRTVAEDETEASAQMHVYWHDPPQPGGHHARVALKTAFDYPLFDTNPAPGSGSVTPWSSTSASTGPLRDVAARWWFGLAPYRTVGLDFDSAGAVIGETTFEVPEASDVRVTGRLLMSDERTVVAEQTQEHTWSQGSHMVSWNMPIQAGIDQFPPDQGGNLEFEFVLEHKITDPSAGLVYDMAPKPAIHFADNWFKLPLSDYHEVIDLNAIGVARLSLYTPSSARLVNPEEVAIIPFAVANHASAERRLEWTLETNADWITMQTPPARLGPGKNATFAVVASPGDLPDGTIAQVLLIAKDVETGIESFGRVAVTVTTGQDLVDERLLTPKDNSPVKESPLPLTMLMAALWFGAQRRRGRPDNSR